MLDPMGELGTALRAIAFGSLVFCTLQIVDPPNKAYERHKAEQAALGPLEVDALDFGLLNVDRSLPMPSIGELEAAPKRVGFKGDRTFFLCVRDHVELLDAEGRRNVYAWSEAFSQYYGKDVYVVAKASA